MSLVLVTGCSVAGDHGDVQPDSGTVAGTVRLDPGTPAPWATEHDGSWSYGAPDWSALDPQDNECSGAEQSPIDLPTAPVPTAAAPRFSYTDVTQNAVDTGATVRVDVGSGSSMTLDGTAYDLVQYHLHTPSEHTTGGVHHDAELHLVHTAVGGATAVVAVLVDAGAANPVLGAYVDAAATAAGQGVAGEGIDIGVADPTGFLPGRLANHRYTGSLTTPPCTEGVDWVVFGQPVEAAAEQIESFHGEIGTNNRPVQPLNDRDVIAGNG